MRRRIIWSGAGLVALVLVFSSLALLLGEARPSFDFLDGREPDHESEVFFTGVGPKVYEASYSFEGDYAAVGKPADTELRSKGFETPIGSMAPTTERNFIYVHKRSNQSVIISKDTRLKKNAAGGFGTHMSVKGWVTVAVRWTQKRDIFSRVRQWIGL